MRKLLILALCLSPVFATAQSYNFNIGGLQYSSGPAVPGACSPDGRQFFKNTTTKSWSTCIGGVYAANAGGLPTGLTYAAPTFTISSAGNGSAVLALSGNTSGVSTCTASAIAGVATNPVTCSNIFMVTSAGGTTAPVYAMGTSNTGIYSNAAGQVNFSANGTNAAVFSSSAFVLNSALNGFGLIFGSATPGSAAGDLNMNRLGAAIAGFGNGGTGDTTAKLKASAYISVGTKFTTNAGCGESAGTIAGGGSTGKITTAGSTSCTTIVTLGDSATAPNGWACFAHDLTTSADYNNPHVSSNATTATIVTGTIVAGDVIELSCHGY